MSDPTIDHSKQAFREHVWTLLDNRAASLAPGAGGRIPNFIGADRAAERLTELSAWRGARVVKSNPDTAQLPVRVAALTAGKLVYMAVPKLATQQPFYLLDPEAIAAEGQDFDLVATGAGAAGNIGTIDVADMQPVDLIVAGSVAVNRSGVRIGKGAGYSDIEVALLAEAGLIGPATTIVTTVHDLQVVDAELPETEHDFSVDYIITPNEVIHCPNPRRPIGIVLSHLSQEKATAIPVLGSVFRRREPS